MAKLYHDHFATPIGDSHLVCDEEGRLVLYGWYESGGWQRTLTGYEIRDEANPFGLRQAFADYFAGAVTRLDALPVAFAGSSFQNQVWEALRLIPAGETWSYGQLAKHLGDAKNARAVGLANGANPIALAVPCHRVIGSDGSLTGYGGGLPRKKWLLSHEAQHAATGLFAFGARQASLP